MGSCAYQVLLVGDFPLDAFFNRLAVPQPADSEIDFLRVATYPEAIQFTEHGHWDAVLVSRDFDAHSGLEFIHHARLLDTKAPIILLCDTYDDDLDYKARKIGATDSVAMQWVNTAYLNDLVCQQEKPLWDKKTKPRNPPFLKRVEGFLSLF